MVYGMRSLSLSQSLMRMDSDHAPTEFEKEGNLRLGPVAVFSVIMGGDVLLLPIRISGRERSYACTQVGITQRVYEPPAVTYLAGPDSRD